MTGDLLFGALFAGDLLVLVDLEDAEDPVFAGAFFALLAAAFLVAFLSPAELAVLGALAGALVGDFFAAGLAVFALGLGAFEVLPLCVFLGEALLAVA